MVGAVRRAPRTYAGFTTEIIEENRVPVSVFTVTEIAYLASQPLGRIATVRSSGTLQVSPVGFRFNADLDTIDVTGYGMSTSRKYRNVADNGRVAFVVDDLGPSPRCVEIRGRAETVADAADGPLIRIYPERIISFGIDQPFTGPQNLIVNARNVNSTPLDQGANP
jgi:pyridoxamine 5'-phosphate oxidase family protein